MRGVRNAGIRASNPPTLYFVFVLVGDAALEYFLAESVFAKGSARVEESIE